MTGNDAFFHEKTGLVSGWGDSDQTSKCNFNDTNSIKDIRMKDNYSQYVITASVPTIFNFTECR
jgi:hypothetical protein